MSENEENGINDSDNSNDRNKTTRKYQKSIKYLFTSESEISISPVNKWKDIKNLQCIYRIFIIYNF